MRPLQSLSARRALHFADDQTTDFLDVVLAETRQGRPPFRVTANQATLTGDRENVYFKGQVRAVREFGFPDVLDGQAAEIHA